MLGQPAMLHYLILQIFQNKDLKKNQLVQKTNQNFYLNQHLDNIEYLEGEFKGLTKNN
uniref:Uncharacterized protein n=1 Tax=Meloidogyne incognita TaxID=6306 RepID=A0A914P3W4_MELIC